MYRAEVLGKLPVIQHFYFGSLLPLPSDFPATEEGGDGGQGHGHAHTFGDCCGIPVPSAFGAKAAAERPGGPLSGQGIRPVPFD